MMKKMAACVVLMLHTACSPTAPAESATLFSNMALWEAQAPASYEIVLRRDACECLPEWLVPVRLTVRNDSIESVVNAETGEAVTMQLYHAMTVDQLFTVIERARTQNAHRILVDYDDELGYPRSIFIDYQDDAADDELSLTVLELSPLD